MKRRILEALRANDGGLTLAALSTVLDVLESTLAPHVDDLYRGGFVVMRGGDPLVWHLLPDGGLELDRLMALPIACTETREITCPYCGYVFRDSWEVQLDPDSSTGVFCCQCEREFIVTKYVEVTYSSDKKDTDD